ncbi:MutS-related protein [Melghirimyces algeriensis]|nr:hypothetical protein [Melghirimyces algeriensis]
MDNLTRQAIRWEALWLRFQPRTPMGQRAKRSLSPFMPGEETEWQACLVEQEHLLEAFRRDPEWMSRMEIHLSKTPDPTQTVRMLESGEIPKASDWFRIKSFLWHGWHLCSMVRNEIPGFRLKREASEWKRVLSLLNPDPPLSPNFFLSSAYDSRLKERREQVEKENRWVRKAEEQAVLDVERDFPIQQNGDGEWVVDRRSPHFLDMKNDSRVQLVRETPFDGVFCPVETEVLKAARMRREEANTDLEAVEHDVFQQLAETFRPYIPFLRDAILDLATLDVQWARVKMAESYNGTRPKWEAESYRIQGGIHPLVAESLKEKERTFTPVDINIHRGVTVIIGPNMGGKTVVLTTVGLVVALGQFGFLVPARSCSMPLVSWMTAAIGDAQNIREGLSTFGAEVRRIVEAIKRDSTGLLLLDEPGRGTNPVEGAALSAAMTNDLAKRPFWTLQVTHFREVLQGTEVTVYRVAGLEGIDRFQDREDEDWEKALEQAMDYRLLPWSGESIPQDALVIARLLGLPSSILQDAWKRIGNGG